MSEKYFIISYFIFSGIILSLLQCAILLFEKPAGIKLRLLLGILLSISIIQGALFLLMISDKFKITFPFNFHLPALFLLGPLMYLYFKTEILQQPLIRKIFIITLILPVITLIMIFMPPLYPARIDHVEKYFKGGSTGLHEILLASGFFLNVIYYAVAAWQGRFFWNMNLLKSEFTIQITLFFLILSSIAGILGIAASLTRDMTFLVSASMVVFFILMLSQIIVVKYPEFFHEFSIVREKAGYSRNLLEGLDILQIERSLNLLLNQEKLYQDPELNMPSLASRIGISSHQLSQYLNGKLNTNFPVFINSFRIEETKRLLKDEPDATVLDIAFHAGFNSKSVFHEAFRKSEGMSPGEYRKFIVNKSIETF